MNAVDTVLFVTSFFSLHLMPQRRFTINVEGDSCLDNVSLRTDVKLCGNCVTLMETFAVYLSSHKLLPES